MGAQGFHFLLAAFARDEVGGVDGQIERGKGFGDLEVIPGFEFPRRRAMHAEGENGDAGELGELEGAELKDAMWAARAIRGDANVLAGIERFFQFDECRGAATRG